ncbi:hypothetical protein VTK73DRAFT_9778 [Phialemonium thermophilum]|uniref:Uncharacterized protein n=1 Tax=Phialemonium thermophilum TaxID=223376 RepID=A0ABR3W0I7_9PEZI
MDDREAKKKKRSRNPFKLFKKLGRELRGDGEQRDKGAESAVTTSGSLAARADLNGKGTRADGPSNDAHAHTHTERDGSTSYYDDSAATTATSRNTAHTAHTTPGYEWASRRAGYDWDSRRTEYAAGTLGDAYREALERRDAQLEGVHDKMRTLKQEREKEEAQSMKVWVSAIAVRR